MRTKLLYTRKEHSKLLNYKCSIGMGGGDARHVTNDWFRSGIKVSKYPIQPSVPLRVLRGPRKSHTHTQRTNRGVYEKKKKSRAPRLKGQSQLLAITEADANF